MSVSMISAGVKIFDQYSLCYIVVHARASQDKNYSADTVARMILDLCEQISIQQILGTLLIDVAAFLTGCLLPIYFPCEPRTELDIVGQSNFVLGGLLQIFSIIRIFHFFSASSFIVLFFWLNLSLFFSFGLWHMISSSKIIY